MSDKRVIDLPGDTEAPFAWVRLFDGGFVCTRCQTRRHFRSPMIADLRREGQDFLMRHTHCIEPPPTLQ